MKQNPPNSAHRSKAATAAGRVQGCGPAQERGIQDNPDMGAGREELFEVVDAYDRVVGVARRSDCHGNPALVHRTAHVVVFSSKGEILLQKRSQTKDIQPGKWDTAVGGHLALGEDYLAAAKREMAEEIGLPLEQELEFLFDSRIRNAVESENVRVYRTCSDGPFRPQPQEIDALRFWRLEEIRAAMGTGVFTPNLETELRQLCREAGL